MPATDPTTPAHFSGDDAYAWYLRSGGTAESAAALRNADSNLYGAARYVQAGGTPEQAVELAQAGGDLHWAGLYLQAGGDHAQALALTAMRANLFEAAWLLRTGGTYQSILAVVTAGESLAAAALAETRSRTGERGTVNNRSAEQQQRRVPTVRTAGRSGSDAGRSA